MTRVLVIGATGYLGSSLCQALLRAGYTVYGLARSEAKGQGLAAQEILPVTGSVQDSASYLALIRDKNIDSVVDASGAMDGAAKVLEDLVSLSRERQALARREGRAPHKLGFVYTSGIWVHGASAEAVDDLDAVGVPSAKSPPATLVAWRPQLERDILAAQEALDVCILRPAMMYGRSSSLWGMLFGPVLAGVGGGGNNNNNNNNSASVEVQADPAAMVSCAHVDDVAQAYVQAVEKVHVLAGTGVAPIFNLQTSCENIRVVMDAFARVVGFKGEVRYVPTQGNAFAEALSTTVNAKSTRALKLLGWQPTRLEGLVAGMEIFARAFVAGAEMQRGR